MSRVCGKIPSQKSPAGNRASRKARTEHDRWFDHGKYHPLDGPYAKRTGHIKDAIPRPKSGVVGSNGEIDYSVRSSYLPKGFYTNCREYDMDLRSAIFDNPSLERGLRESKVKGPASKRPPAGHFLYDFSSEKQVRAWTRFANSVGIQYSGQRMYKFPRELLGVQGYHPGSVDPWPTNPFKRRTKYEEFCLLKDMGKISHKRSLTSKLRRSARRAVRVDSKIDLSTLVIERRMSRREAYNLSVPVKNRPVRPYIRLKRCDVPITPMMVTSLSVLLQRPSVAIPKVKFLGSEEPVEVPMSLHLTDYGRAESYLSRRRRSIWRIKPRSLHYGSSTIGSIADDDEENLRKLGKRGVLHGGTPFGVYESSSDEDEDTSPNWWM